MSNVAIRRYGSSWPTSLLASWHWILSTLPVIGWGTGLAACASWSWHRSRAASASARSARCEPVRRWRAASRRCAGGCRRALAARCGGAEGVGLRTVGRCSSWWSSPDVLTGGARGFGESNVQPAGREPRLRGSNGLRSAIRRTVGRSALPERYRRAGSRRSGRGCPIERRAGGRRTLPNCSPARRSRTAYRRTASAPREIPRAGGQTHEARHHRLLMAR